MRSQLWNTMETESYEIAKRSEGIDKEGGVGAIQENSLEVRIVPLPY